MALANIVAMVEHYLPVLVTAGDYACNIQSRISGPEQKSGPNAWAKALTDADLTVQTFIEVATLSRYPDVGFYGEESEHSYNRKYFDTRSDTVVHLDPINGTFLYKNQRSGWDIILSISHQGQLMAAISYMPAKGLFYLAVRGIGAVTGHREHLRINDMQRLRTITGSRVCLTYQAPDVIKSAGSDFECFDLVRDYSAARDLDNLNDLFTGRLDAFACRGGELLDWGAVAFIVCQAGGVASCLDGSRLNAFDHFRADHTVDMLVSTSSEIHKEILHLLR
jgi:fructose-1,6-bisphosphatase/inositol monophosphatase family enzyme